MARQETYTSNFYCTKCGKRGIPLARKISSQRTPGHLKKLYCPYCKTEENHVEIRPFGGYRYEDFLEEFTLGRFIKGKRVEVKDLLKCKNIECKYNKNGKCWNANESFKCKMRTENNRRDEDE